MYLTVRNLEGDGIIIPYHDCKYRARNARGKERMGDYERAAPADAQPKHPVLHEILAKSGLVYSEKGNLSEVLCKPKILPIKSMTLERIETMEAQLNGNSGIPATAIPK